MTDPRRTLIPSLALAVVLLVACGDDDDVPTADASEQTSTSEVRSSEEAAASGDTVTIERSRFDPQALEVATGTEVTFENLDSYAHTVTSADGSAAEFDSGELAGDETFEQTFAEPGSYEYICEIHPTMRAEIVVS